MSVSFNSLGRNKLHTIVAQQIVDHISSWRLRVGDMLPGERRLSSDLGISRAAVREALKYLSAKGVVEVSHGRKTIISADPSMPLRESLERFSSSDETILNLYEVRESFEGEIARLAAERATTQEVDQLADLVREMEAQAGDEESFCQMLWMWGERILHDQAAFFSSPSTNTTPAMTWSRSR